MTQFILQTPVALSCLLFTLHKNDCGILVISVSAFGLLVPLSTLEVHAGTFTLTKYYIYALMFKRHIFTRDDIIDIIPTEIELSDSSFQTSYNSIFDLLCIFSSANTVNIPSYELKWKGKQDVIRKIRINEKQYFDIIKSMRFPHLCP